MALIKGPVRIGIRGEYTSGTISGYNNLWQNNTNYCEVKFPTSLSIDDMSPLTDDFDSLADFLDHHVIIRDNGGGSFEMKMDDKLAYELLKASTEYPFGVTDSSGYDPEDDTNQTEATDVTGYEVIIEEKVSDSSYIVLKFHNCKISARPTFSPKQAIVLAVTFSDARHVEVSTSSSQFTARTLS